MKKNYLILSALILLSVVVCAEKRQLGDYVELDGIPSIVVHVDESGEHGLLLSVRGIDIEEKQLPKLEKLNAQCVKEDKSQLQKRYKFYFAKRAQAKGEKAVLHIDSMYVFQQSIIDKSYSLNRIIYTDVYRKTKSEEWKSIYSGIKEVMAGSGEENMTTIIKYCASKGLSMKDYFPMFYWAQQMGEGWFIPGNNELELLAKSCGYDTVGITHPIWFSTEKTHGDFELYDKFDADRSGYVKLLSNATMGIDYYWFGSFGGVSYWPLGCLQSSTMVASEWSKDINNVHKAVTYSSSSTTSQVFDLTTQSSSSTITQAQEIDFESNAFYSTGIFSNLYKMETFFYLNSSGYKCAMHRF